MRLFSFHKGDNSFAANRELPGLPAPGCQILLKQVGYIILLSSFQKGYTFPFGIVFDIFYNIFSELSMRSPKKTGKNF
jgi:hypothetical protein